MKIIRELQNRNGITLIHYFGHGYVVKNGSYEHWSEKYQDAIIVFNYETRFHKKGA